MTSAAGSNDGRSERKGLARVAAALLLTASLITATSICGVALRIKGLYRGIGDSNLTPQLSQVRVETIQMCDAVCLRVVLLMMLVTLAFLMMAVAMQHRPLAYYAAAAGLGITGVAVLTVFFG